ncbi:galactitol-1-phosphate 5-dehydrogenase [Thermoanaerobacterium sp. DL9XJH110]|uniref:galactitol-1-phosphate 5-dehydrogenase n=1 Tax=Thermoanaerobacterium sp. DL9XJH110 TaxID=3386643 RepID=UPI003BB5899C
MPVCEDDEVLIRVKACGICGSDLGRVFYGSGHVYPIVLGHEFSGEIVAAGAGVSKFKPGDRVTAAPLVSCGRCFYCRSGRPALCESYNLIGTRINGAMAEYVKVKAANVLRLPEEVDFYSGAMVEPVTVAIHAVERIFLRAGASVALFGAGTIGLLTLQCLKARGAGKVFVIDVNREKLKIADRLGADKTLNPEDLDVVKYIKDTGGVDMVFETAGVPITQKQSLEVVKKQGSVVYVGTASRDITFPSQVFEKILRGELNITGSWMSYSLPFPGYEWDAAINYIKEGKIKTEPLISGIYKIEDLLKPFEQMQHRNGLAVKNMFGF